MRKLVIVAAAVVVSVLLSIVVTYGGSKKDTTDRDRGPFIPSNHPEKVAEYLFINGKLSDFVEVNPNRRDKAIKKATDAFYKDWNTYEKALARAKEIYSEKHDVDWDTCVRIYDPEPEPPTEANETATSFRMSRFFLASILSS